MNLKRPQTAASEWLDSRPFNLASCALVSCALALGLFGCGPSEQAAVPTDSNAPVANAPAGDAGNTPGDAANAPGEHGNAPAEGTGDTGGKPVKVVMETSKGTIELELYPDKAPITVKNYVEYVKKKHFDGTIFHRVIPTFMIQGGGFTPDMTEKETGPGIKNEADNGLKNDRGTIAMARTPDPHSATAQFFINVQDNAGLNYPGQDGFGYTVFGKVTKGMETVDAIKVVPTASQGGHDDVPVEAVLIKSVKVKEG